MTRALEAIRSLRGAKATCKQRSTEFTELTEHLKRLWDHFGIPEFHRQLYLARYCSGKFFRSDVLLREVQALVKGKALVQRVMKAIESREEVLLRLSVLRSAFGDLELREPGTLGRCQLSEQLYCLRLMTAQAVQVLHSWRVSVAPVAGAGCVAGPGSRGACWPFTVSDGGVHWDDYLMHIMRNDSAVRQFAAVVELAPEIDPLLLHGAVGGIGPFQQGKLCPPCVDLQLQYLEQARLLLLEEELTLVLFSESRAPTPGERLWSLPESRASSRPSSRLVEELTAPLAITAPDTLLPRPPSGRGLQSHSRPRSAAGARRRTKLPGPKKEEPPMRQSRSMSRRKKKKPRLGMWKAQPLRESRTAPESQEVSGDHGDEDIEKELKDLINAFQMTRKKSITDFQGVPKLMKGQTASSEQRDPNPALERGVTKKEGQAQEDCDGDENIQPTTAIDLKDDEAEVVLRCGIDMARFQSVWNRFENDNAIHHDDVPSALARIGFVGPEKKWVEDAFSKVTEFNGVSREEFMQIVDLYDERQRENFEEKFISCDADGSGQMDIAEFADFLRTIGIEPMKHVLQECFDEFDEDRSGQLSFDKFYKVMTLLAQREGFSKTEVRDFEAVFNKFDAFCHDEVEVQELQQVLMYVGIPTTIPDCQMVAEIVDLDDSGYVDFQEFLMCMRLFRDRELAELKNKLQALGTDDTESILPCEMLNLLQSTGYVADQEVVNEVLQEIGIDAEEQIGLGSLWKFLVIFRQREGLTREETMRVRKAFKKYASGDEGDDELVREVQTDDIPKLLRLVGYTLALEEQKQPVAQVDIDRSASLNILELKKLVRFVRERRTRDLQATINKYDRSDTGVLSEREALKAFKDLGCLREDQSVLPDEVVEDLKEGFLSHAAFTRFVQEYDWQRRRQLIDSGGYTIEQMEQLRRQFAYYDWDDSGDVSKKELVQLIVDVFPDMAFDPDKRPLLLQIMRETDSDSNGKLDFWEFLQLMRTVEDLEQLTQLQKERGVIDETRFTSNEVSEFRNIFLAVTKGEPRMNLADFKEMMSPVCPMGDKNSHAISAMWMEICDSVSKMFDFPDFLLMMRRLLDMNFANMNQRLGRVSQRKTHQF